MLHTETVERATFELLETLMQDDVFANFHLVGGTALALCLGHRLSVDIDMFTNKPFDPRSIEHHLSKKYSFITQQLMPGGTIMGRIDGIKVDFILHEYNFLEKIYIEDNIRMFSLKDIAAMKLAVISDNGTRLKDFIDMAYLSTKFSLMQMFNAYEAKYTNTSYMRAARSLGYFVDIDFSEPINMIDKDFSWPKIENRIREMIADENKIFTSNPL